MTFKTHNNLFINVLYEGLQSQLERFKNLQVRARQTGFLDKIEATYQKPACTTECTVHS